MLRFGESRMKLTSIMPSSGSIDEVNLLPRDSHSQTLYQCVSLTLQRYDNGKRHFPQYVHSCRFLSILVDSRTDIYAIAVCYPLNHTGRQGTLSFGHTHLPEKFLMWFYPIAQGSYIHSGIRSQLLSCHCFHC